MNIWPPGPPSLRRWFDALVAMPARFKLPLAALLAVVAHLVLFFILWLAPLLAELLRIPAIFPRSCSNQAAATPTPTPAPTPKPKLELASMEVIEKVSPPPPPALPLVPPPPPPPAAPLTAAEEAQLQKMFEELPKEEQWQYIDVEGLARKKNLSKRALFESWRDSVAGSRKPGKNSPLPNQDGSKDAPFTRFKDQEHAGVDPRTFEEKESGANGRSKPLPSVKFPGLEAPPIYKPRPVPKTELANSNPARPPTTAVPDAASLPPPPPAPAPRVNASSEFVASLNRPKENEPMRYVSLSNQEVPLFLLGADQPRTPVRMTPVALVKPEPLPEPPKPKPTPAPTATPKPTPPPTPPPVQTPPPIQVAKLSPEATKPTPVKNPTFATHMEKKKIEGGGPEGDSGVDAVATERGKYAKMLNLMVAARWKPAVDARGSLMIPGQVSVRFAIDAKGRLVKFKVEYNSSNNAHAMVVEEAMRATKFEPPPAEMLRNGLFEDEFNFVIR